MNGDNTHHNNSNNGRVINETSLVNNNNSTSSLDAASGRVLLNSSQTSMMIKNKLDKAITTFNKTSGNLKFNNSRSEFLEWIQPFKTRIKLGIGIRECKLDELLIQETIMSDDDIM